MKIFIPSSNRGSKQTTFDNLPDVLQKKTSIVIPAGQHTQYAGYPIVSTPFEIKGIGPTRQWICDTFGGNILMLDDDLVFFTRRTDKPTLFSDANAVEMVNLFFTIKHYMDAIPVAHGGVAPREGANRFTESVLWNVRCLRALFYNADILAKEKIKFTDMEVMEDFHVALSLLERGYPSLTLNHMVQNQNGSNLPGGCSEYRTLDVQARAAARLKELHPEHVDVVVKKTKVAWGGQERTDVKVWWKNAYNSSGNLQRTVPDGEVGEGEG